MDIDNLGQIFKVSPIRLDYLTKQYTGFGGQYGLPMLSKGQRALKVISDNVQVDPVYRNEYISHFYDLSEKLKQYDETHKLSPEQENLKRTLARTSSNFSKINKLIRAIDTNSVTENQRDEIFERTRVNYLPNRKNYDSLKRKHSRFE